MATVVISIGGGGGTGGRGGRGSHNFGELKMKIEVKDDEIESRELRQVVGFKSKELI